MVPPSWNIISSTSVRVRVQVKALYDIPYNVSVETLLCGIFAGTTAATTLYYGKMNNKSSLIYSCTRQSTYLYLLLFACKASSYCENPGAHDQLDTSVEVIGYLKERGNNISFSCPLGLVLAGPNSSTCTGNGEWEPDPRDVICRGKCVNGIVYVPRRPNLFNL